MQTNRPVAGLMLWPVHALTCVILGVIVGSLLLNIAAISLFEVPGHDEIELLHASYLIGNGERLWIDFFEHHSPIYLWINSWLLGPNTILYVANARLIHLFVYIAGGCLFAYACYLWLEVESRFLWPFISLAVTIYFPQTDRVDFALARPEGYAFAALFAASILGYKAQKARSPFSYWFLSGALLFLAISLSPRTLPLAAIMGGVLLWPGHNTWAILKMLGAWGLAFAVVGLLNIAIAPGYGFYLWFIQFNGRVPPFSGRVFLSLADASIDTAVLAAVISLVVVVLSFMSRYSVSFAKSMLVELGSFNMKALYIGFSGLFLTWSFLFLDKFWGRQGFSAVVVATSFYLCLLIAITLRLYRDRLEPYLASLFVGLGQSLCSCLKRSATDLRSSRYRGIFSRPRTGKSRFNWSFWVIRLLAIGTLAAVGVGVKVATSPRGWSLLRALPVGVPQFSSGIQLSPSAANIASYFWWPGWPLLASAILLLTLTVWSSEIASRVTRARTAAIAVRIQFLFLTVSGTCVFTAALSAITGKTISVGAATAVAGAAALAKVWPGTRVYMFGYAILVAVTQYELDLFSPSQIAIGAVLGVTVSFLTQFHFAVRRLGFFINPEEHMLALSRPARRRTLSIIKMSATALLTSLTAARNGAGTLPEQPSTPLVRKILARVLLVSLALCLTEFQSFADVAFEAGQQEPSGTVKSVETALVEGTPRMRTINDLPVLSRSKNLAEWILQSNRFCKILKNETVVMDPREHPICVRDASFYWYIGSYLRAMKLKHIEFNPRPPFRLEADLKERMPAIMGVKFVYYNFNPGALDSLLRHDYMTALDADGKVRFYVRRSWYLNQVRAQ